MEYKSNMDETRGNWFHFSSSQTKKSLMPYQEKMKTQLHKEDEHDCNLCHIKKSSSKNDYSFLTSYNRKKDFK